MTQLSILSGIKAPRGVEFDRSFPVNLEPILVDTSISKGQLRLAPGAVSFATGPGVNRGGVNWRGLHYRVMGTKLCMISAQGDVTEIGDVGGTGRVKFAYSFDRLAIKSGTTLFYYNGATLFQVTDPDLGAVIDLEWTGGYFMTTDGTAIVVTELADPTAVDPLKYGSAENDPDSVTGVLKLRDEIYVFGRNTIETFQNVGGNGFPFRTITGAVLPYGCVSASAKCLMGDRFAFVGSAKEEALGVYIGGRGAIEKVSTKEIDDMLAAVSAPEYIELENRTSRDERRLLIHLPDRTLCYYLQASALVQQPVWTILQSGQGDAYRLRDAVEVYSGQYVGDTASAAVGLLSYQEANHFGDQAQFQFEVGLVYNEGRGAQLHSVELIALTGRTVGKTDLFMSVTTNGLNYSRELSLRYDGSTARRIAWRPHFEFRNYMGLRFRGLGNALTGFVRCEANLEPLSV